MVKVGGGTGRDCGCTCCFDIHAVGSRVGVGWSGLVLCP